MAERKIKWTAQQRLAISRRGSDVLVTASAGTGKTAVLSGRCVDIVSDKKTSPGISNMLVLTFTDAAAEQMQQRIREHLKAQLASDRSNTHLLTQLTLLAGADISTIHSFCKRLISEYFYQLDIDPNFRVIDTDEQTLLKFEALEKTLEWAWGQENLQAGLDKLFYARDLRPNGSLAAGIISISDFLNCVPATDRWLQKALALTQQANPFGTELGKEQKKVIEERLIFILNQLNFAKRLYESRSGCSGWPADSQQLFAERLEKCIESLKAGDWNNFTAQLKDFDKPRVYKPKDVDKTIAELIAEVIRKCFEQFAALSQLALLNPDYLDRISGSVSLAARTAVELVRQFDRFYSDAKRAVNCMDFADLEHYALRLLVEPDSLPDEIKPSQTAMSLRRKYRYIFVDEYQDINPVQEAIIKSLSSGDNVFVVGDIKQSIYAFRGAEPKIFLGQLTPASIDPAELSKPLRVDLNANFRSAGGILDFVNRLFSRIMTKDSADIDYDSSAFLKPASQRPTSDKKAAAVELHILDRDNRQNEAQQDENESIEDDRTDSASLRKCQAAMIAHRIKQMVGAESDKAALQIYDEQKDCMRDVEYGDIVVLMRSPAKRINDYVQLLRLSGIPVSSRGFAGYFEATEVSDMMCLLKVLDNPQRDIELAAVLRSPIFNVTDTELAKIRIHEEALQQCRSFYDCVAAYVESGEDADLSAKLEEALQKIETWRDCARAGNLADLLWQIYRKSSLLSFVSALPDGRLRRANLLKLHDRAIQFEAFASSRQSVSLGRFVEFIERLEQAGAEWALAEPLNLRENAVTITSIHKSKGLEFPVVIVTELDNKFNVTELSREFITDANLTLGLELIDKATNSKLTSLAHQVIAEKKLRTALAEEMRILYVAATRAKDRLILTGARGAKHCRDILLRGFFSASEKASGQLQCCNSFLDWILYGLADQRNLREAFETGFVDESVDNDLFDFRLYGNDELKVLSDYIESLRSGRIKEPKKAKTESVSQQRILEQLKENINWRYQYESASALPAKRTVTQLTHSGDEFARLEHSRPFEREPVASLSSPPAGRIDSRIIGTAAHLVISSIDLTAPVTKQSVEKTKQKLVKAEAMSKTVADSIDAESIIGFFKSQPGRLATKEGNVVWREWPFTFALPVSQIANSCDETIVVQGIIDMLIITPEGLIIVDFKTDSIAASEVKERAELYRSQLDLYAKAAQSILKKSVLAKWLYFLNCNIAMGIR